MVALLIRHGHADPVGRWVTGRRAGVSLNAHGREQTSHLVRALQWMSIAAVYSSPLERARETAHPLASDHGLDVRVRPALTDVDFGAWTGRSLDELSLDPEWQRFNRDRRNGRPPEGEPLTEVQRRIVGELLTLSKAHDGETVAIVTHAEPIRCAVAAFTDTPLDAALAIQIDPARVSALGVTRDLRRVLGVNLSAGELAA